MNTSTVVTTRITSGYFVQNAKFGWTEKFGRVSARVVPFISTASSREMAPSLHNMDGKDNQHFDGDVNWCCPLTQIE
eukprot:jgi/Psemu1/310950/fgenesh1_kg.699_\